MYKPKAKPSSPKLLLGLVILRPRNHHSVVNGQIVIVRSCAARKTFAKLLLWVHKAHTLRKAGVYMMLYCLYDDVHGISNHFFVKGWGDGSVNEDLPYEHGT